MGLLTPCFVPRGWFLYTIIVPEGGFLLPSSRVRVVCPKGCKIKIFWEAGVVTPSKPSSPYEQLSPLLTPCFKMFLERSLNDTPPPHFKHLSLLPPPHLPPLPPIKILILHGGMVLDEIDTCIIAKYFYTILTSTEVQRIFNFPLSKLTIIAKARGNVLIDNLIV